MGDKLSARETLDRSTPNHSDITGSHDPVTNKTGLDTVVIGGTTINAKAKFVEAIYTNSDMTVTYNYYESSSKVTLYNTITTIFTVAQDTEFTSAEWS